MTYFPSQDWEYVASSAKMSEKSCVGLGPRCRRRLETIDRQHQDLLVCGVEEITKSTQALPRLLWKDFEVTMQSSKFDPDMRGLEPRIEV